MSAAEEDTYLESCLTKDDCLFMVLVEALSNSSTLFVTVFVQYVT